MPIKNTFFKKRDRGATTQACGGVTEDVMKKVGSEDSKIKRAERRRQTDSVSSSPQDSNIEVEGEHEMEPRLRKEADGASSDARSQVFRLEGRSTFENEILLWARACVGPTVGTMSGTTR